MKIDKLKSVVLCWCIGVFMVLFTSCAGTINTVVNPQHMPQQFKKAYIVSSANSQYIHLKMGIITPFAYIVPADDPAQTHDVIGNTAIVLKNELDSYGIQTDIGKEGEIPTGYDLIVFYQDTWRWDFKKILDRLEIVFVSGDGKNELARSIYNIYRNKELHDFPTPKKEVPKMIKELLK